MKKQIIIISYGILLFLVGLYPSNADNLGNYVHGVMTMENEKGILLNREKIFSVDFKTGGVTYIPGEGPEDGIWPNPVYLKTGLGLWMADCGEDRQSWKILEFAWNGNRNLKIDLVKSLEIKFPEKSTPIQLVTNEAKHAMLLISLDYDFDKEEGLNYTFAIYSPEGQLLSKTTLPDFVSSGNTFILSNDKIVNLETHGKDTWFWYYPNQVKKPGPKSEYSEPVAVSNQIIERIDAREFRILAGGEEIRKIQYKGENSLGGEPVRGEGHYFGFIRSERKIYEDPEKEKTWETTRDLEIFFWDEKNECIIKIGKTSIAPRQLSSLDWSIFTYYVNNQCCFDAEGNFYEIAWSAKELTVYVYKLDTKKAKKILKISAK